MTESRRANLCPELPATPLCQDAAPRVCRMENHDAAYGIWQASGRRERILIHLDAHDDMWWCPDHASLTIGNFISLSLAEGLVREVVWVVPNQTWENPGNLKPVLRRLKKVSKGYPGGPSTFEVGADLIFTRILGKPLRVCSLDNLPPMTESVLLDIDVDYLVIPRSCHNQDLPAPLPWLWPEELVAEVAARGVRSDLVTISYSVEGGYTPLKWKYLGDELEVRLRPEGGDNGMLHGLRLMRTAAQAVRDGAIEAAEAQYLEARRLLPDSAAPDFHLAHLYLKLGRSDQAAERYREALRQDATYRTAFNNAGRWQFEDRRFPEAEGEFRDTLVLDPEDAYAHLGLGQIAATRKNWGEAEAWLRKALSLDPHLVDAYRTLGEVQARRGQVEEAIALYERSLLLALKGFKPLTGILATEEGLMDSEHFLIHGRLARLYEANGETERATNGLRMCIAKGGDGVLIRLRLGRLYLKQRQWQKWAQEILQAGKNLPKALALAGRRIKKGGRRFFRWVGRLGGFQKIAF
jgi:tetratricopeptide (TPR) repeat protein